MLTNNESRAFAIDASIGQCPILVTATLYPLAHTATLTVVGGGYLMLTARWLSRYENDLLLGLCPTLFYKVSALLLKQFESRYKEFFVLENITHLSHLSHLPYSPILAIKAKKK